MARCTPAIERDSRSSLVSLSECFYDFDYIYEFAVKPT